MESKNYYSILECSFTDSYEEIKKSYQNLILQYHPDKQSITSNVETKTFMEIDEAWKVLRDPVKRKIYTAELLQQKFNERPIVHEIMEKGEFSYNSEEDVYYHMCRCGGIYYLPAEQQSEEDYFISCDECSLVIQIK